MMPQSAEADALLKKVASEAVVQGENLRANVRDMTLRALQARQLSMNGIRQVLKTVTEGVNLGAAQAKIDVEKPLADALAGMDDALQKVVRASQVALERLFDHGAEYEDSRIRKALGDLDKMEDEFLRVVRQSARGATDQVKTQWSGVLKHLPPTGTAAGARAHEAAAKFAEQMHTQLREQRVGAAKLTHSLAKSYHTLASGILIGMSEGLRGGGGGGDGTKAAARPAAKPAKKPAKTAAKKAVKKPKAPAAKPKAKKKAAKARKS